MAIALLSGALCAADEDRKPGLGMWVWPQTAFDTAAAREQLLAFCAQEGITHFDQHISIEEGSPDPSVENADALAALHAGLPVVLAEGESAIGRGSAALETVRRRFVLVG